MKLRLIFTALFFSLVYGGSSVASDFKIYSGANCSPISEGDVTGYRDLNRYTNWTSGDKNVFCQIMNDERHYTGANVTVRIYKSGYTKRSLSCSLKSYDYKSNLISSDSETISKAGFRSFAVNVNSSSSSGTFGLYCRIPKGSSIYNYYVYER